MVFGLGVIYEWLQTYISFKVYHANLTRHVGSITLCLRILLSVLNTLFFASSKCLLTPLEHVSGAVLCVLCSERLASFPGHFSLPKRHGNEASEKQKGSLSTASQRGL